MERNELWTGTGVGGSRDWEGEEWGVNESEEVRRGMD